MKNNKTTPIDVLQGYDSHNSTISSLFESRTLKKKDSLFVSFEDKNYTWQEFYSIVATISASLSQDISEKKIKPQDKVIVVSTNSEIMVALYLALADQDLCFVPLNPDFGEAESKYVIEHSEATRIYSSHECENKIKNICSSLKIPPQVYLMDEKLLLTDSSKKLSHRANKNSISLILYTSGTTGFPKGVLHSQETAVLSGEAFTERMWLQPDDKMMCILPFFHINALFYSLMGCLAAGASLLLVPKFSASKFWQTVADNKVTQLNIIAAIGNILSRRPRSEFRDDHVLEKIYGAPVSKEIEMVFQNDFKVPIILEGYGMTEIPGAINNFIYSSCKTGTMGKAAKHPNKNFKFTELKIVDENEEEVPVGEVGELVVKTPLLMKAYFKDPLATQNSFTKDMYFKTGDLVKLDNEGFYVFVARQKDIIRCRGENIAGAELDRIANNCPGIIESASIGVASALGEEDVLLVAVKDPNIALNEEDLHSWMQKHLSKIKWPRFIVFVESLPHTPTARVAKYKLKTESTELLKKAKEMKA